MTTPNSWKSAAIHACSIGVNKVVHSCFGDNSRFVRLFGDRGLAVVLPFQTLDIQVL